MQEITINGKTMPVNFGTAAIMRLEQLTGIPFYKFIFSLIYTDNVNGEVKEEDKLKVGLEILQRAGVGDMAHILYAGLYGGAKKERQPFDMTFDDLIDELDECEELLPILTQALFWAFAALPQPKEGTGKKKVKAQRAKA